ncbi:DJ-1/PfpI family protein [Xylaria flabelliformis]|nr:DJ-1/PfpI family protein [Xylaria flabelliformis]
MAPKVLVVLTSFGYIEAAKMPTGWYLPELAHPYDLLTEAGVEIVTASPKGGVAPLDPVSVERFKEDASARAFLRDKKAVWEKTQLLSAFKGRADEFEALFYPGGQGPMFDLVDDADSITLIEESSAKEKPVAAVCHGPIVLVNAKRSDGKPLLARKEATGFSNVEEDVAGTTKVMPFSLEDRIKAVGGNYRKADQPLAELVVVQDEGRLITGQNPARTLLVRKASVRLF